MSDANTTHEVAILRYQLEATIWWSAMFIVWSMMGLITLVFLVLSVAR